MSVGQCSPDDVDLLSCVTPLNGIAARCNPRNNIDHNLLQIWKPFFIIIIIYLFLFLFKLNKSKYCNRYISPRAMRMASCESSNPY